MSEAERILLSENFYLIPAPNHSRFPFCNSFLITGKERVLIDAGIDENTIKMLDREKRIDILIISHSHPDHIRAWHILKDRYLMLPKETPDAVKDLGLLGLRFTETPEKGAYWTKSIKKLFNNLQALREPDGRYKDNDILDFGNFRLRAIHAPGHLDDHYCFMDEDGKALLTTDIDFTSFGPWYGNVEGNIRLFKDSIRKIMALPYSVACSSHKMPIFGDATSDFNAFLACFDHQRQSVLNLYKSLRNFDDIVAASPFYQNRFPDKYLQDMFEAVMIKRNLELIDE